MWRLTPPFAPPQTPWVGECAPIHRWRDSTNSCLIRRLSLRSDEWVEAFNEIKAYGGQPVACGRMEQTNIAKF